MERTIFKRPAKVLPTSCRQKQINSQYFFCRQDVGSTMLYKIFIFCFGILFAAQIASAATLQIQITPKVSGENLQPASLRYRTSAGENFSITRVSYLVSEFELQRDDGSWLEISNSVAW